MQRKCGPRNQGLITIRTLNDAGIKTNFIVDSAVRSFIHDVDLVIVGADAVTVNGAVVNKIGTSQVAHTAAEARVNVIVAAETYKFAPRTIIGRTDRDRGAAARRGACRRDRTDPPARHGAQPGVRCDTRGIYRSHRHGTGAIPPQMAYVIIREYLGWGIGEFHESIGINTSHEE